MTNLTILCILLPICGYFIGSLSPATFLSKKVAGIDIRKKGSKNPGSSNVFRVLGAKWGLINFLFDILKGFIPTLIGLFIARAVGDGFNGYLGAVLAGGGVLIGHALPIFAHFKGGKCVASMTGAMFVLYPILTAIIFVIAITIILTTRYVALASLTAFILIPISVWVFEDILNLNLPIQIFTMIFSILILVLHRENIKRLINGEENKLNLKKKKD